MDIVATYTARRSEPYPGLPMECVIEVRLYPDGFVPTSAALGMGKTYTDAETAAYDLARRHGYTIVSKEPVPTPMVLKLYTLSGKFGLASECKVATDKEALAIVEAHAASGGYTNVKRVYDHFGFRYTARTPGGRSGRNIAALNFE